MCSLEYLCKVPTIESFYEVESWNSNCPGKGSDIFDFADKRENDDLVPKFLVKEPVNVISMKKWVDYSVSNVIAVLLLLYIRYTWLAFIHFMTKM